MFMGDVGQLEGGGRFLFAGDAGEEGRIHAL